MVSNFLDNFLPGARDGLGGMYVRQKARRFLSFRCIRIGWPRIFTMLPRHGHFPYMYVLPGLAIFLLAPQAVVVVVVKINSELLLVNVRHEHFGAGRS